MEAAAPVGAERDQLAVGGVHGAGGFEVGRGEGHGGAAVRGRDHRTFWTSAISRSPAGARVAAPLVARVNDRVGPVRRAGRRRSGSDGRGGPGRARGGEELTAGWAGRR